MKKRILIAVGLILMLAFTGCTKSSSAANAVDRESEASLTAAETVEDIGDKETVTENITEEPTKEEATTKAPSENLEDDYNAEDARKKIEESDIPDSIKSIFLSDGEFIDTQTQKEMKLSDYKLYEIIYLHDENTGGVSITYDFDSVRGIAEWHEYVAVDFDNDGKKELFYDVKPDISINQGVIFHENTDGRVYAYRHPSLRVNVNENGDVLSSGGADLTAQSLGRYSFDTEKYIYTVIADAKQQEDGGYKYYAEGQEVDLSEYEKYFKQFWESRLDWTEFRIVPDLIKINWVCEDEEAKRVFEESDIPDSIKNIFLSDGQFIETVTQTEMNLSEYKLYEKIFDLISKCEIVEWNRYVVVDFDGDGKNEVLYEIVPQYEGFGEGVIFHENTDGKVYVYRDSLEGLNVNKNGDVLGSAGTALTSQGLYRYSFDTEKIVSERIVYAEPINGRWKYYVSGQEVNLAQYETYFKLFWESHLDWTEFILVPDSGENKTASN